MWWAQRYQRYTCMREWNDNMKVSMRVRYQSTLVVTMCLISPDLFGKSIHVQPPKHARVHPCPNQTSTQGPPSWPGTQQLRAYPVIANLNGSISKSLVP